MTQSMTAFALCETDTQWGTLSWELRSVNHRYLEMSPRTPEILRVVEPDARALVGKRLSRGKVDMNLRFQPKDPGSQPFELDQELLTRLLQVAEQVQQTASGIEALRTIDILRWPGTLRTPDLDPDALVQAAMALLQQALDELQAMRRREGARGLKKWIADEGLSVPDLFAHSHGGTVAHLSTKQGLRFDRLVLMGWPSHRRWFPDFSKVNRIIDVRVRLDLVILSDLGRQRFRTGQFNIEEHRHGWFDHSSTHDPDYWNDHDLWSVV